MNHQDPFFGAPSKSADPFRRGLTALTLVFSVWLAVHATVLLTKYRYVAKTEFADGSVSIFILNEARGELCRVDVPTNSSNKPTSVVCK